MRAENVVVTVNRSPLVSVVLPVFNGAATTARAVASIRAQTLADWELVVVDDGSTDGTREILRGLAREEPRMHVIERPHAGVVAAANAALAVTRGEFVARMDADDEAFSMRLAEQAAWLAAPEHRDVGVVGCLVEFGGDREANAGYALHVDWVNALVTAEAIALERFVEAPVVNPSVMFRRELPARHGRYREGDFPEDYELWLRWLDAGVRMAKVPRVLLRWNDSPGRLTRRDSRYAPDAFFRMKAEWIARWLEAERMSEARRIFVWGAGRHTRKRAAYLEAHGVRISGYVDVDVKKTGRGIGGTGLPVLAPADLPAPGGIFVLGYVTSRGARDFIRAELQRRVYVEGRDFLMCA